jgi:hypothetical protein
MVNKAQKMLHAILGGPHSDTANYTKYGLRTTAAFGERDESAGNKSRTNPECLKHIQNPTHIHHVPLDIRAQNGPLANSALVALIDGRLIGSGPLRSDQLVIRVSGTGGVRLYGLGNCVRTRRDIPIQTIALERPLSPPSEGFLNSTNISCVALPPID